MTNSNPAGSAELRDRLFRVVLILLGGGFALFFAIFVLPGVIASPDLIWLIGAGFTNPIAAGWSTDTLMCWFVLAAWVIHERVMLGIRHGWIALLVGLVPGVATGFALYLLIRMKQAAAATA